jgi:hypothetical protein
MDVDMTAPDVAIMKFGTAQLPSGTFQMTTRFYPATQPMEF